MEPIENMYFILWRGGRIDKKTTTPLGGPIMIFRQFLAPKTGCASYLFG
jgi:hypothetical protein